MKCFKLLSFAFLVFMGCRPVFTYSFSGYVFNGVTGEKLQDYTIEITSGDEVIKGRVKDGKFMVGPLREQRDYAVNVSAPGFRAFSSINEGFAGTQFNANRPAEELLYREVTLFPESIQSPATRIRVILADSSAMASGTVQLRPAFNANTVSSSFDNSGVALANDRRWVNSLDLQSGTVVRDFSGGVLEIEAGVLILGVSYNVVVFGVPDYGVSPGTNSFIAGSDNEVLISLSRLDDAGLQVVDATNRLGNVQPDGRLAITFNYEIELDPSISLATLTDLVDAGMSAYIWDGATETAGALKSTAPPGPQLGVTVSVQGNQLIFAVASPAGMLVTPPVAPSFLSAIAYPVGLSQLSIRRKGTGEPLQELSDVTNAGLFQGGRVNVQAR